MSLLFITVAIGGSAAAQTVDFEPYSLGSPNGQDGWVSTGSVSPGGFDHKISTTSVPGFGAKSLRISNEVTSGSFGDQTFSKPTVNEAGETSATNDGMSGGVRKNAYQMQFSIASKTGAFQPGLLMSVAPDRGDGARMSYLRFEDLADGIHVYFDDYQDAAPFGSTNPDVNGCGVGDDFTDTDIATLSRTAPHTIQFVIIFVDGARNDLVKIYIDGVLEATGTSWEDYYRFCAEQSPNNSTHTVDSLLFRTAGPAVPGNAGNGFLIDNMKSNSFSSAVSNSTVIVNHTDINNWVFYDDNTDKVDPTLGSFVTGPGTTPLGTGSAQISATGTDRKNLATYQFAGTPLDAITTMKFSTYNPSAGNGGSANRSGYLHFNVDFNGSDSFQRRLVFVPSNNGAILQNTWQEWDTINGGAALWLYSGTTWPAGVGGGGEPGTTTKTWNQILTQYPGVRMRLTDSFLGIRVGEPYADGYTEDIDAFKFGTAAGTTTFDFDPATTVTVTPTGAPNPFDNDYTRINNAVQAAPAGSTVLLSGTFNWTEPFAAASWALGSDGQTGGAFSGDDYSILPPANRNNLTITAASLGAATIQGPGDLASVNLEGVFQYYLSPHRPAGINQNLTISNLRFLDFDNAIYYDNSAAANVGAFNGTKILNNYILVARDLNATVAPTDVSQNIGIHYSFGTNQQISGNQIDFAGNGVSDGVNFSTEVGMQSNTSGGAVYDGLQITNNTLRVIAAQSANPEVILGIWENGHAHTSNINVSGNSFTNQAVGNNPVTNLQRGFRVTSHSSGSTQVFYTGNTVSGANIGIQWIAGSDFTGNQPVRVHSNTLLNNATGILVQSNGISTVKWNRIVGNGVGIANSSAGSVVTTDNWWGCNYGPGAGGVGCTGTANGITGAVTTVSFLQLVTSALPTTIGLGDNSAVTSQFVGTGLPSGGTIPNGVPVAFAGTLGTVAPSVAATSSGAAGTTFTATAFGAGGVNTTVDQQVVNAAITITASCSNVSAPTNVTSLTSGTPVVPISVDDVSGRGISSADFTLTFNPAVVTFNAVNLGTVTAGSSLTVNSATPGVLKVSIFRAAPYSGAGTLANVTFNAVGLPGTSSPVTFSAFKFNEGSPCSATSNGLVTILSGTITGRITYGNPVVGPNPRGVPGTTLSAAGSVNVSTVSQAIPVIGNYTLSGMGSGPYTVTPSKTGGDNGAVSGFDAAKIAGFVVGNIPLNATQQTVADVSGTGGITSFDAALIARYTVALPGSGTSGNWIFILASRSYPNVNANQTGQDYSALLMGDVTGNWNDPIPEPGGRMATVRGDKGIRVMAGTASGAPKSAISVPVTIPADMTGKGLVSYQFQLTYDPNVIEPQAIPVEIADTISDKLFVTANTETPGTIKVVIFGALPIEGKGALFNLKFTALGNAGDVSPLTFENFMFNEGDQKVTTTSGHVTITAQPEDEASIEGRLFASSGLVPNTRVTLTNSNTGETYTVLSNPFGVYRFGGIKTGRTYVISVESKDFTFAPQAISLLNDMSGVDLRSEQ
ncbi:MAG TPA: cohesin domain-containing protein [Pyrinomonadaceae bacterium]|nr:cohesin domain-containing protein [Pyrinomonadaceae bacterium]